MSKIRLKIVHRIIFIDKASFRFISDHEVHMILSLVFISEKFVFNISKLPQNDCNLHMCRNARCHNPEELLTTGAPLGSSTYGNYNSNQLLIFLPT